MNRRSFISTVASALVGSVLGRSFAFELKEDWIVTGSRVGKTLSVDVHFVDIFEDADAKLKSYGVFPHHE